MTARWELWPANPESLIARQRELGAARPDPWRPTDPQHLDSAGCWVCFPRRVTGPGTGSDPAWCVAVLTHGGGVADRRLVRGTAAAPYVPGLLALRVGPVMEQAVRMLPTRPAVLLLDATGRDHPRRAGLALHLGAELDLPTVGVTHRPLMATGSWPGDEAGAVSPLRIGDEVVGAWLRTRAGVRPLAVHPGWRTDLATAVTIVRSASSGHRTPEPLRQARHLARLARDRERRSEP